MPLSSACIAAVLSALVAAAPALPAQQSAESAGARVAAAANPGAMRAHEEFLADDALEGRAPATRGGEIAALYLKAQFERLGLKPMGDSGGYFHKKEPVWLRESGPAALQCRRHPVDPGVGQHLGRRGASA